MSNEMTIDQAIESYLKLRDKKAAMEARLKEKTDMLNTVMTKLEHFLMEKANEQGVDSFKTDHGTAFIRETDYANVEDWDAVLDFIEKQKAYEFLTKKVNKIAVREYIEENEGSIPPGMAYGTRRALSVRIPATKKK
jgi:uncharacterized protein YlxP (DUF503 family)